MSQRKRTQLEQAVIRAARAWAQFKGDASDVVAAINALDEYGVTESLDGPGSYVHGSPETSAEAATLARALAKSCRRDILNLIRNSPGGWNTARPDVSGWTCKELEHALRKEHETVSSAVNWLMTAGWLRDSGLRRNNPSGRRAVVWCLTEAALEKMRSPEWVAQQGRESA